MHVTSPAFIGTIVMEEVVKPNNMATMLAGGWVVNFAAEFAKNLATQEIVGSQGDNDD